MAWIDYKNVYNMVLQSWIIDSFKMYKIVYKVIKFIEETMKNWREELTAEGESLAEMKIQRCIFQGDALSPLLFIIATVPLNHILRKCTSGYKPTESQEKIHLRMYMDDIKLYAKNEKKIRNRNSGSENIVRI